MNSPIVKMLKNSPIVPTFTNYGGAKQLTLMGTCTKLEAILGDQEEWPATLKQLKEEDSDLGIQALGLAISFLEDALILDRTLKIA